MLKLKNKPLQYLCTVYTSHPKGLKVAYMESSKLLGQLLEKGERIFCPISHCHTAAIINNLPKEFDWWMDFDEGWIDKCDSVLVATMENWDISKGITHEIAYAKATNKPVRYLNPTTLEITT